jgi:hypothetical protein
MKLFRRAFWTVLVLGIAYVVLVPSIIGCGFAWVTVRVHAVDATTREPIPAATVTLISECRTKTPEMQVSPPTVLTAQTDSDGHAIVKDMFGAGFDNWGTSVYVGTSSIRCEATGYSITEARIASSPRLRFRDFLIYKQPTTVEVSLFLTHQ